MVVNEKIAQIITKFTENKLSHAFLLETNDYEKCLNDLYILIKNIMCPNEYSSSCEDGCDICYLIEHGSLPSVQIISPDGLSIKKEQILTLKNSLQTKSFYTDYKIYIIKQAEKMNKSSFNTMLKILEEPEGQVVVFLLTDEKEKILETVRSRTQVMNIYYTPGSIREEFYLSEEEFKTYVAIILEYVKILETDPVECVLKNKSLVLDKIKERDQINLFFKIMEKVYALVLEGSTVPEEFEDFTFLRNNPPKELLRKLKIINKTIANLAFNTNLELSLDKFVMEIRR